MQATVYSPDKLTAAQLKKLEEYLAKKYAPKGTPSGLSDSLNYLSVVLQLPVTMKKYSFACFTPNTTRPSRA